MNKPTPFGKKTFAEYEKEVKEYNLSKVERVELSIVGDLKAATNTVAKLIDNYEKSWKSLSAASASTYMKVQDLWDDWNGISKKAESFKKVNNDYNKDFAEVASLDSKLENANKDLIKVIQEAKEAAKELGVDVKDIGGYGVAVQEADMSIDISTKIQKDMKMISKTIGTTSDAILDITR